MAALPPPEQSEFSIRRLLCLKSPRFNHVRLARATSMGCIHSNGEA
jgi:hypothetical protein